MITIPENVCIGKLLGAIYSDIDNAVAPGYYTISNIHYKRKMTFKHDNDNIGLIMDLWDSKTGEHIDSSIYYFMDFEF